MKRRTRSTKPIRTHRPLLDLPDDHPARRFIVAQRQCHAAWQPAAIPGCRSRIIFDHREAIRALQQLGEDQPGRILRRPVSGEFSTHFTASYTSPAGEAFAVMASWFPPDADDPERIEGGWCVFLIRGPLGQALAMRELVAATAQQAATAGEFLIFSPS